MREAGYGMEMDAFLLELLPLLPAEVRELITGTWESCRRVRRRSYERQVAAGAQQPRNAAKPTDRSAGRIEAPKDQ